MLHKRTDQWATRVRVEPVPLVNGCGMCRRNESLHVTAPLLFDLWGNRAGKIIKDIREASGAHIKILPPEDLPACALSNDRVVQLTGNNEQLTQALRLVARQIRENPPKERPGGAPPCLPHLASGGA